jgi:hypothetical protein
MRSRNSRSCEMTSTVAGWRRSQDSSQTTESRSRWLVGSSSNRRSAGRSSARASARRLRHPPENAVTGRSPSDVANPKPCITVAALATIDPSLSSASAACACASRISSWLASAADSSARAAVSGAWPASTYSIARWPLTSMSCATCAMRSGGGASMEPASRPSSPRIAANSVDLPQPLAPTRPTRSPGRAISETPRYSVRAPRASATSISLSMGLRAVH